jgi:hypothetical protein
MSKNSILTFGVGPFVALATLWVSYQSTVASEHRISGRITRVDPGMELYLEIIQRNNKHIGGFCLEQWCQSINGVEKRYEYAQNS